MKIAGKLIAITILLSIYAIVVSNVFLHLRGKMFFIGMIGCIFLGFVVIIGIMAIGKRDA